MLSSNIVRDPIVLNYRRVIHRNVRDALLKIRYRITAKAHHFLDQDVRICHRSFRIVYELRLGVLPGVGKLSSLILSKRFDVQLGHALLPLLQKLFGASGATFRAHRSIVFRPEL